MAELQANVRRTSSNPPSKRPSGIPYIIASAVLVVVMVAMVVFKIRRPEEPQRLAPVYQSVSAVRPKEDPMFDIPPPPDLDASTSSEASTAPVSKKAGAAGADLCAVACQGTNTPQLEAAVRAAANSRACYERALRSNAMIQGRVKVALRIAANGAVCSAGIAEDSLHSPEVTNCLLGLVRSRPYPPPGGNSCVDLFIPVTFVPQEGKKQ